jgi:hypothetical protein
MDTSFSDTDSFDKLRTGNTDLHCELFLAQIHGGNLIADYADDTDFLVLTKVEKGVKLA